MASKRFHLPWRMADGGFILAVALACIAAIIWSDSPAAGGSTNVNFHAVTAGGNPLRSSCYRMVASVGQVAPGYSSSGSYSLSAGFIAGAPTANLDEIFFNGFEAC